VSAGSSPQASTSVGQTRPAPEDVTVGTPPFPDRPLLTTPPRLIDPEVAKLERECLAAQPGLGLAGLLFAFAVFFALALGVGNVGSSLLIFGPLAAFGLAAIAMVAFWWEDWPGGALQPPFSGLVNVSIVVVAAVALTILGATVVERLDLRSIFLAIPGPAGRRPSPPP
jgi:hypothetical protein